MSISTGSYCIPANCAGSEGMTSLATPHSGASISTANGRDDVLQGSNTVRDAWASELRNRIHVLDDRSLDWYFDTLVPSSTTFDADTHSTGRVSAFTMYHPVPGQEVASYDGLRLGCQKLVSTFPKAKRMAFVDTHSAPLPFPFASFAKNHHTSKPDITVSFPGEVLDAASAFAAPWRGAAMVMEVKPDASQDPFMEWKSGNTNNETIIQIARNARNLMLAHGFLASFVVGIYGDYARIARFDHACALVSKRINFRREPQLLQRFFWHFVHPRLGTTVVGCDPTVSQLRFSDQAWVKARLKEYDIPFDDCDPDFAIGRKLLVYDDENNTAAWYIVYKLIDVNARLFSRATMVWHAIEDTRKVSPKNQRLLNDPNAPPRIGILKESWRQLVRNSEASFYHRLAGCIPDEERIGLTKLEYGGDMGQVEVREWEQTSSNTYIMSEQRDMRLNSPGSQPGPTSTSQNGTSESTTKPYPLPFPQHQTFSWTLARGESHAYRERSHMRIIVSDVGRPITKFRNTKELVAAFRDAIIGHMIAWKKAGVLHRDISVGNILISERKSGVPGEASSTGFIHDFDYSSMTDEPPSSDDSDSTLVDDLPCDDEVDFDFVKTKVVLQKERTGTYYFLAMDFVNTDIRSVIHRVKHDLESFYWVLVWVVLRHTVHSLGQSACEKLFKYGDDEEAFGKKDQWIGRDMYDAQKKHYIEVEKNAPLTKLMHAFKCLVRNQVVGEDLSYDTVLPLFEEALASDGWPDNDWVPCTLLDAREQSIGVQNLIAPKDPAVKKLWRSNAALPALPIRVGLLPHVLSAPPLIVRGKVFSDSKRKRDPREATPEPCYPTPPIAGPSNRRGATEAMTRSKKRRLDELFAERVQTRSQNSRMMPPRPPRKG